MCLKHQEPLSQQNVISWRHESSSTLIGEPQFCKFNLHLHIFLITNMFVTVTVLCSLNRMGWWWLSRTGSALLSGWFWHSLHAFVLCHTSTGYTSRCPVQASGRDWHDIEQRWRKSYIWSSSWHEIPRHGGLRYDAKHHFLYCTWSWHRLGWQM